MRKHRESLGKLKDIKLHKTEEVIFAENEIAKQKHLKFLLKNEESQASLTNLE